MTMPNINARRLGLRAACVLAVLGTGGMALATPSRPVKTALATSPVRTAVVKTVAPKVVVAPKAATPAVAVMPALVVVSPAAGTMSGIAPDRTGGMVATGIPIPPPFPPPFGPVRPPSEP